MGFPARRTGKLSLYLPILLLTRCLVQIGTGAAALMAIRVLLDHGVQENHIVFVTFLGVTRGGMVVIRKAFPRIRFVCGAVDDGLREDWLQNDDGSQGRRVWSITPGMGSIGDRYYL
jgi:uridine kinase